MEEVELHLYSKSPHISMVVVGFLMLESQGIIKLKLIKCYNNIRKYPHAHFVEVIVNNKIIVYDCWDLCDWTASDWEKEKWKDISNAEALINGIDFYFKRSYMRSKNICLSRDCQDKIYPLGLSFHVSIKNNPIDIYDNIISYDYIKYIMGKYIFPCKSKQHFTIDKFEALANFTDAKNLKIMFMTRLWDPSGKDVWNDEKKAEREYINKIRIEIIKKIKQLYPNNFVGGVEYSDFTKKHCKKLIFPKKMTNRSNYLDLMKKCDICIGTMGLHESIGWKTAEYVVAARAIVNERMRYEVPYSFEPYKNYLPFETSDECVVAVSALINDPEKVYQQKKENEKYYKSYLRPDKQILKTLDIVSGV